MHFKTWTNLFAARMYTNGFQTISFSWVFACDNTALNSLIFLKLKSSEALPLPKKEIDQK